MPDSGSAQKPLVSVLMMTYNHAQFIGEAIESVLNQQTQYPLELIICDDASTDGTQEIAREYAAKDSRIILSFQPHNTRFGKNFVDGCDRMRGEYMAFCEGDDYWTSPHKLEKQVGYLEGHADFAVCAHKVQMLDMNDQQPGKVEKFIYKDCSADEARVKEGIFYADEAIANYYFQTGSLVLRRRFKEGFPPWFRKRMMFDHFFFMLHAVEGKIKYFDEVMSVWRRHGGGYTWLQTQDKGLFFQKEGNDWIDMYRFMDNFFSKRFTWQIDERINLALRSMVQNCLETGNMDHLSSIVGIYQDEFKKVLKNRCLVDAFRMVYPDSPEFAPPWSAPVSQPGSAGRADTKRMANEAFPGNTPLAINEIPPCPDSVWQRLTDGRAWGAYFNLRSALAAWLWQNGIVTVWVPAYAPPRLLKMLHRCQFDYQVYGLSENLRQNCDFLSQTRPGDAVVGIEYLGMPLSEEFCKAMASHSEIHWLVDRAQSLLTTSYVGAEAYFYSPPKLFGVPDGGLAVTASGTGCAPGACVPTGSGGVSENILLANLERPAGGTGNHRVARLMWEEKHQLSQAPMSKTTQLLLERIPYDLTVVRRRENWETLFARLGDYCLFDMPRPDFAPYAFPFLCPPDITCESIQTLLAREGITTRRMWYPLPVGKRQFPVEEACAKRLLLLPVDSCLGLDSMGIIIDAVERILDFRNVRGSKILAF